jgi:hypothetical protein
MATIRVKTSPLLETPILQGFQAKQLMSAAYRIDFILMKWLTLARIVARPLARSLTFGGSKNVL